MVGQNKFFNRALFLTLLLMASASFARDFVIYSISQDIPMGEPKEEIKKNYYVNIGEQQGVEQGTLLDVYRTVSRNDPYTDKKRYKYEIKLGELKVLHSEENAAIGIMKNLREGSTQPYTDIETFMVGDSVDVKVE